MNKSLFNLISKHRKELMGVAALWILMFHSWFNLFGGVLILGKLETVIRSIGFVGVDIFFFLSGFGLPNSYEKSGTTMIFYKKRAERILLPYIITGLLFFIYYHWNPLQLFLNLIGYNFYFVNVNSFLWFIPAILTLYLLFPLYYLIYKKTNNKNVFIIISLIIWLIIACGGSTIIRDDLYSLINRIPVFILGIYFNDFGKKHVFDNKCVIVSFIILLVGIILSYLTNVKNVYILVPGSNCFLPNLLLSISMCLLLSLFFEKITLFNNVLSFFGSVSLEFYCLGQLLSTIIVNKINVSYLMYDVIILLSVSFFSYLLFLLNRKICGLIK